MTEKEAQKRKILNWMLSGNAITQRIAEDQFDCTRLSARIWELNHEDGVPVKSTFVYKHDNKGRIIKKWKMYWIA